MAQIALFISAAQMKSDCPIDENVDEKVIIQAIRYSQEEYTKNVLGTALYDEVKAQILAGTLTALNTTLRDSYIREALKWWVMYEGLEELHFKFTNKSVMTKTSENSNPASLNDILDLKNKYRNRAERMDKKTINYLCENSDSYPLYLNPGNGTDTITPKASTYNTGWYLGGASEGYDTPTGNCCD